MEVQTFRAHSMQEALQLVRRTLGPEAAVLQAKEVGRGAWAWLTGAREIEVLALSGVHLPSRFEDAAGGPTCVPPASRCEAHPPPESPADLLVPEASQRWDYRAKFQADLRCQAGDLPSLVERLAAAPILPVEWERPLPSADLLAQMRQAEISPDCARDLLAQIDSSITDWGLHDPPQMLAQLQYLLEQEIQIAGPICLATNRPRVVALIGPTGVGKTTTIAKLAAEFRLRKHRRVGFITMDTWRIAAVDQIRAYAEVFELPLEVVSTPREMRNAVERLSGLDLILIDTAGRSPRDEVRLQELKSLLGEAQPDEVHLVLSAAASTSSLIHAARRFQPVGVTAMVLTKLDEATKFGGLLSLLRDSGLPISYLTDGQRVPEDIRAAESSRLAKTMLGLDTMHAES
jgi:flagellar biosynthesis protein FlhF